MAKIIVQDTDITVLNHNEHDYILLTDMANAKESTSRADDIIKNWINNHYTIEFLNTWEIIHNSNFKMVEFVQTKLSGFVLTVSEWIDKTNTVDLIIKKERYESSYVYKDIAFEFGSTHFHRIERRNRNCPILF